MREIALHILDIAKNSTRAGAKNIRIDIVANKKEDSLLISIVDDGCGMSEEFLKSVMSPFSTTRNTRKVGMGIPLLKEACEQTGGTLEIISKLKEGTSVKAVFKISSIDRMPLGDVGSVIALLIQGDSDVRFILNIGDKYTFDTEIIKNTLDSVSIIEIEVLNFITEHINENITNIYGGINL